jgi:hypothetical protein
METKGREAYFNLNSYQPSRGLWNKPLTQNQDNARQNCFRLKAKNQSLQNFQFLDEKLTKFPIKL